MNFIGGQRVVKKLKKETATQDAVATFLLLRDEGNDLLEAGDLQAAVKKYTEALSASQGIDNYKESCKAAAIALASRSLAHLRLGNAARALADGQACKARDRTNEDAQSRIDQAAQQMAAQDYQDRITAEIMELHDQGYSKEQLKEWCERQGEAVLDTLLKLIE